MKSFYCYSFGCRVNQAEKEVIDGEMQNSGFSLKEQSPNISIINTCAVTHKAEREAKQLIFKLKSCRKSEFNILSIVRIAPIERGLPL